MNSLLSSNTTHRGATGNKPVVVEQRRHGRASAQMRAAFKPDTLDAHNTIISNISLGGAWLDMLESQPVKGCEGKLHVVVGEMHLYLIAKVVRHTAHGIGISFIDMGIETYGNLKTLVEEVSRSGNATGG
ncbi:MAG: PilZ domain-containing protein [Mariprofundaceae bacterium]|nr:PilZ domain-containing protein [Mariprofundaceae bacterium]